MSAAPALTLLEGPPGLHGWHTLRAVVINARTGGVWPRFKLTGMTGFRDRADIDDNRASNTGRVGESVYPGLERGKTVVMQGIIQAKSVVDLDLARTLFVGSAGPVDATNMHHTAPSARGGVEFDSFVRVIDYTCEEDFTYVPTSLPSPWQRNFTLTYRMHHPYFFETTNPHTATDASALSLTNGGNAPTEPKFTITHTAGDDITITNTTTGKLLKFVNCPGGDLIVVFIDRTAKVGSTDCIPLLDDTLSTWWDEGADGLTPGVNAITISGASGSTTADWLDAVR